MQVDQCVKLERNSNDCAFFFRMGGQVCQGGKVPESFYMSPDGEELDHMSVAHVAHGEKLRLQYGVTELGCILR